LIDFCAGITYFIHLEEKLSNSYRYYIDDEDYYILVTLDGIDKQIYIGNDIPISYGNLSFTIQPLIYDIVDELKYFLE